MPILSKEVNASLLRDIVKNPTFTCDEILKLRPEYSCAENLKASRNRFNYLKGKKQDSPQDFWNLYGDACEVPPLPPLPVTNRQTKSSKTESAVPDSSKELQEEDKNTQTSVKDGSNTEPTTPAAATTTTPTRVTRSSAAPLKESTKQVPKSKKRVNILTSSSLSPPKRRATAKMSATPIKEGAMPKGASAATVLFKNLEEAIEMCDFVSYADFDHPEALGHGLTINEHKNSLIIRGFGKAVQNDRVKITNLFMDLRDYELTHGMIVLGGQAFLVRRPSLPTFVREDNSDLLSLEAADECIDKVQEDMAKQCNAVRKDADRFFHTILIVMPEGVICTTDMFSLVPTAPTYDSKVRLFLREFGRAFQATKATAGKSAQLFYPGHWTLRVVNDASNNTLVEADDEVHDLSNAFEGMHLPGP